MDDNFFVFLFLSRLCFKNISASILNSSQKKLVQNPAGVGRGPTFHKNRVMLNKIGLPLN